MRINCFHREYVTWKFVQKKKMRKKNFTQILDITSITEKVFKLVWVGISERIFVFGPSRHFAHTKKYIIFKHSKPPSSSVREKIYLHANRKTAELRKRVYIKEEWKKGCKDEEKVVKFQKKLWISFNQLKIFSSNIITLKMRKVYAKKNVNFFYFQMDSNSIYKVKVVHSKNEMGEIFLHILYVWNEKNFPTKMYIKERNVWERKKKLSNILNTRHWNWSSTKYVNI
jgi:hypothetical protein